MLMGPNTGQQKKYHIPYGEKINTYDLDSLQYLMPPINRGGLYGQLVKFLIIDLQHEKELKKIWKKLNCFYLHS
jgi:hypothetical protein